MDDQRANQQTLPAHRVVLLGASNLARGISTVVETARCLWGQPLEILAAFSPGRSYGLTTSFCGSRLPGISTCGLWSALVNRTPQPTTALVTDIGNDLMYGVSVPQIVTWVDSCLERLKQTQAHVILTGLPVSTVSALGIKRFWLLKTVFFPQSRLKLDQVIKRTKALNDQLEQLAQAHKIPLICLSDSWFGFDPIHIRRRQWPGVWHHILRHGHHDLPNRVPRRGSFVGWLYLRSLVPQQRQLFGFLQRRTQPAGRLADGSTVALY